MKYILLVLLMFPIICSATVDNNIPKNCYIIEHKDEDVIDSILKHWRVLESDEERKKYANGIFLYLTNTGVVKDIRCLRKRWRI